MCYNDYMNSYREHQNMVVIEQTRKICDNLPGFVGQFITGIQLKTTPLTRLGYARDLKIFFEFLVVRKFRHYKEPSRITLPDINSLRPYDIELFLEFLSSYVTKDGSRFNCNNTSKHRKLASLRSFFKFLYRREMISENITEKVEPPKIYDNAIRYLEPDEIAKLLDLASTGDSLSTRQAAYHEKTKYRDIAIISIFLGTGIRISECVGLDRNHVDLEQNSIVITRKGGSQTQLYFSDEVKNALETYINWIDNEIAEKTEWGKKIVDTTPLFYSLRGNRITPRAVQMLVEKYCNRIAPLKRITPHKLRSTYGTMLYRETQDIYVVADVLGHHDVNTTKKHYAAISDDIRKKAANTIKLRDDDWPQKLKKDDNWPQSLNKNDKQ